MRDDDWDDSEYEGITRIRSKNSKTSCLASNPKFEVGDRVKRPIDVYDPSKGILHGVVTEIYAQDSELDGNHWHDPEVYKVRWDTMPDYPITRDYGGYFSHGLYPE